MPTDPIVAEIRRIREQLAARFGHDIRAIVRYAQERDASGDREVVRLPPRLSRFAAGTERSCDQGMIALPRN
jgi:hypothetical protein